SAEVPPAAARTPVADSSQSTPASRSGTRTTTCSNRLRVTLGPSAGLAYLLEEVEQVVGVLLLHRQDVLDHAAAGRVVGPEPADDLLVGGDGHPLGDEILLDHVDEVLAGGVFGVTAFHQGGRVEV